MNAPQVTFSLTLWSLLISHTVGLHEIVTYNSRSNWNSAIGGNPTWCVNFNYLTSDSRISVTGTTFLDTNGISRQIIRGSPRISDIDNPNFNGVNFDSGPNDGTTYAALYVDIETGTTVRLSFVNPNIRAWSAEFKGIDNEGLLADIVSTQSSAIITQEIVANANTFFGFTINEDLQTITLRAKNGDGSTDTGEVFSVDNICAYMPSPPPTPTPPTPSPGDDECDIDIFIIGWIICFLKDILSFIF